LTSTAPAGYSEEELSVSTRANTEEQVTGAEIHGSGQIPLILIHGAWISARSWENYADYFGKRGFAVSAPEWPRKYGDVEEIRESAEESAGLGVQEIVDHYEALIRASDQPPVLVGHSYGGLFVELLLDRGLRRAGAGDEPGAAEGHPRAALLDAQGRGAGARAPIQVASRGDAHA
jgi:pimeloyl-ACP methyl ester carboxylesterase